MNSGILTTENNTFSEEQTYYVPLLNRKIIVIPGKLGMS